MKETKSTTPEQAKNIRDDILKVVRKHNLWCTVEEENKPNLDMIRIKEISIKVGKEA